MKKAEMCLSYHIVSFSPWPLLMSMACYSLTVSSCLIFSSFSNSWLFFFFSLSTLILTFFSWSLDVIYESFLQGNHTMKVKQGLSLGMVLFILSEVMFFFSLFWGLYTLMASSNLIGGWPPAGVIQVDQMSIPLLGTFILISSSVTLTWAHHALKENMNKLNITVPYLITVVLGLMFMILQYSEFKETSFSISDGSFGTFFFMITGFHGLHVLIGLVFLSFSFIRFIYNQLSTNHHLGFEFAAWYWHFVDVVWLFVYVSLYWLNN